MSMQRLNRKMWRNKWGFLAIATVLLAGIPFAAGAQSPGELVQSGSANARIASVTLAQQPAEGNLLIAVSSHRRADFLDPVIDGEGWTMLGGEHMERDGAKMAVWYKIAGTNEPATVESTWLPEETRPDRAVTFTVLEYGSDLGEYVLAGQSGDTSLHEQSVSSGPAGTTVTDDALVIAVMTNRPPGQGAEAESVEPTWSSGLEDDLYYLGIGDTWPIEQHVASLSGASPGAWDVTASWTTEEVAALLQLLVFEPEFAAEISGPDLVAQGWNVTLNSSVSGNVGEVSYQWFKEGVELPGENDASLSLPSVSIEDDGAVFMVEVTDSATNVATATFTLAVVEELPAGNLLSLALLALVACAIGAVLVRRRLA